MLLCLILCLTLLASLFPPPHLSLKHLHCLYILQRGVTQYDGGAQPLSLHQAREGLCPGPHWALLAEKHRQQAQPHCHIWGLSGTIYMYMGVLCCFALFVCLTLLASFFLPSHLSFKNMYMLVYILCIYMYHIHVLHAFGVCVIHVCMLCCCDLCGYTCIAFPVFETPPPPIAVFEQEFVRNLTSDLAQEFNFSRTDLDHLQT